jgi:hypothetical protein
MLISSLSIVAALVIAVPSAPVAPDTVRYPVLNHGRLAGIAVGKVADLIIVNGRPAEKVSDLRNLEQVIRAGRVYEPRALRAAMFGAP